MEECCLLPCTAWLTQFAFLNNQELQPRGVAPPTVSWTLLPHQTSVNNAPQVNLVGTLFSAEFPFFQMTSAGVKLTPN